MKIVYKDILVGLMFILGIAGIFLGEFIMSMVLIVTADILRGTKLQSIEKNVA
jgi:hypothetical protein